MSESDRKSTTPSEAKKIRNGTPSRTLVVLRQNQHASWAKEARERGDHVLVLGPPWWFRLWWRIRRFFGLVNDTKAQAELDARYKRLAENVVAKEEVSEDD